MFYLLTKRLAPDAFSACPAQLTKMQRSEADIRFDDKVVSFPLQLADAAIPHLSSVSPDNGSCGHSKAHCTLTIDRCRCGPPPED
jgi:hypothetical protein